VPGLNDRKAQELGKPTSRSRALRPATLSLGEAYLLDNRGRDDQTECRL